MVDNAQLWGGQRQSYMPGTQGMQGMQGMQRMPYSGAPQTSAGVGGLTREKRQEAKRLSEEASFSFAGYQVVRREFISHRFDPAMTIRGNSITFKNSCISKLEDATYSS